MKNNVLIEIEKSVRNKLEERKKLQRNLTATRKPLDFRAAFIADGTNIIAELKPKSPSEGYLCQDFKVLEVAGAYVKNGARALSVLTEEDHFGGHQRNLELVRKEFPHTPLLMKDFILDEYQIYEAAFLGADAILLIVALLSETELARFSTVAENLKLSVLVEVHNRAELQIAMQHKFKLIGVNNRNLKTMEISLETARDLVSLVDDSVTLICESGLKSATEINEMKKLGYRGFLIGSALMKSESPGQKLRDLIEASR